MTIPCRDYPYTIRLVKFLPWSFIYCWNPLPGWFNRPDWSFILLFWMFHCFPLIKLSSVEFWTCFLVNNFWRFHCSCIGLITVWHHYNMCTSCKSFTWSHGFSHIVLTLKDSYIPFEWQNVTDISRLVSNFILIHYYHLFMISHWLQ